MWADATAKEILDTDDKKLIDIMFIPQVSKLAKKVFGLVFELSSSCQVHRGMDGSFAGLDINKMEQMAERRGFDLARYYFFTSYFSDKQIEMYSKIKTTKAANE